MSPDEHALLQAVAAAPADDLPRLVLADYLDENGQPVRAEFIRLQCRIARLEGDAVYRHVPLFRRQQELLDDHLPDLLGPEREELAKFRLQFDRGLPNDLTLDESWIWDDETRRTLATMRPLPRVTFTGGPGGILHLLGFDLPWVEPPGYLDSLEIVTAIRTEDEGPMGSEYGPSGFRANHIWSRLEILDLSGCRIGDRFVGRLLQPTTSPVLTDLDLSVNDLTDAGVIELLNTGLPRQLRRLILGGNPLTDQAAFELADRLGGSTTLKHLNLRFTNIGPAGQQALLARFGGRVDLF